jgi:hypothetical protein
MFNDLQSMFNVLAGMFNDLQSTFNVLAEHVQ